MTNRAKMLQTTRHRLYTAIACCLLSGCVSTATSETADLPQPETAETAAANVQPLDGRLLFQLLLAEMATNRGQYGAAASLYSELGNEHNDIEVIRRAIALNHSIGNYTETLSLSEKWLQLRPDSSEAYAAVALARLANADLTGFEQTLGDWLNQHPEADISLILPALDTLTVEQQRQVKRQLTALAERHPKSASVRFCLARLEFRQGNAEQALTQVDASLALQNNLQAQLLKYSILMQLNETASARRLIEQLSQRYPSDRQVAVQYTRMLMRQDPVPLDKLQSLHDRFASEPIIARSYARAAYSAGDYDAAQAVFNHLLLAYPAYSDEAHYFLGSIDVIYELPGAAAEHFAAIENDPYLLPGLAEWVQLGRPEDESRLLQALADARSRLPDERPSLWRLQSTYLQLIGQPDKAWATLQEALAETPDQLELLYHQAMLAPAVGQADLMEQNLIRMLEIDPDNTTAMNALGYTWVDNNKNLAQAADYIDIALAAEPDNPAIQDSKGWLLYRTGDLEGALVWLKKAYAQMENEEVAAHIAEVLWFLNRRDEARFYLNESQRIKPDNRFAIPLQELFND